MCIVSETLVTSSEMGEYRDSLREMKIAGSTLTWHREATSKRIAGVFCPACTDRAVVNHVALCCNTTRARTRVPALLIGAR